MLTFGIPGFTMEAMLRVVRTYGNVFGFLSLLAGLAAAGCASSSPARSVDGYSPGAGGKAARTALSMIGRPYKYRGELPSGFDCSGLVRYSYRSAGMDVPHGTRALRSVTRSVPAGRLREGDLVFFLQRGKAYSHVGIYVGNDRFVHAPSSGKSVRADDLTAPYWKKHFLEARRFI